MAQKNYTTTPFPRDQCDNIPKSLVAATNERTTPTPPQALQMSNSGRWLGSNMKSSIYHESPE